MKKLAVTIILPTFNSIEEVVAVSRRNDTTQWGLPGGKVDPLESPEEAICRETKEETGIYISADKLVPLYAGWCYGKDGQDFWTITYLCEDYMHTHLIVPEEGLEVSTIEMIKLCNETVSPFAVYNQNVIPKWRAYKG